MFDDVPIRVWLLIGLAAVAIAPVRYLFDYVAHAPDRRDIACPHADLGWRTRRGLAVSLAALASLAVLAVFIHLPIAARFATSPSFWPLMVAGMGGVALWTVVRGWISGRIEPLARGFSATYERATQPKRFWAALCWNAVVTCFCFWASLSTQDQVAVDRCYDRNDKISPGEVVATCTRLIFEDDHGGQTLANLYAARGIGYHDAGSLKQALSDYNSAIRLDPSDSFSLHNRGLVHDALDQRDSAIRDYTASLKLRPDNGDALLNRGMLLFRAGDLDQATIDLTRAYALDRNNMNALAHRGLVHASRGNRSAAERDFGVVRARDPANAVLLRGSVLLSLQAGKVQQALGHLDAALARDPGDAWSRATRAEVYRTSGEHEKERADLAALAARSGDARRQSAAAQP